MIATQKCAQLTQSIAAQGFVLCLHKLCFSINVLLTYTVMRLHDFFSAVMNEKVIKDILGRDDIGQ